ncbi:hypothetical protein [Caviibacterium pharyngocola]|uniref:O-antigen polymerase n=1 Tax=Caviibacterium pharyngocola TaxID=28159 RepID=A0A2M8RXA0_9PAST|nr:hypothetical protein [Caviibacterium pharyngocola]PJG83507.1 hypothetical protein CVP04_03830 [Caviibacterium pharyngocola]
MVAIKSIKLDLRSLILFILISCIPFQNFILNQSSLGIFGTNLSMPIFYLLFSYYTIKNIKKLKVNKSQVFFIGYILLITLLFLLFSDFQVKGVNLVIKAINNMLIYSQPFIVFYIFNKFFKEREYILISIKVCFFIFIFLLSILILTKLNILNLDDIAIFNGIPNHNMRPRLFSMESSHAVTVFITFGMISLLGSESKIYRIVIYIMLCLGIFLLQSKSGILLFFIISIFLFNKLKFQVKLILVLFMSILFYQYMQENFSLYFNNILLGFEEYTSFTTRTTLILAGILSLFIYPLGTGFGAYISLFDNSIQNSMELMNSIFIIIGLIPNFSEVETYLIEANNYSTKSLFFDFIMYFGVFGLLFFYKFHKTIYNNINNNIILFFFIFLTLNHTFFVDSVYLYNFWFGFAFIYNYWRLSSEKYINIGK